MYTLPYRKSLLDYFIYFFLSYIYFYVCMWGVRVMSYQNSRKLFNLAYLRQRDCCGQCGGKAMIVQAQTFICMWGMFVNSANTALISMQDVLQLVLTL